MRAKSPAREGLPVYARDVKVGASMRFALLDDKTKQRLPERRGNIWSAGPERGTYWVLPDDDPANAIVVKLKEMVGR